MIKLLRKRFESFECQVFSKKSWCKPRYWTNDKDFRFDELNQFSSHFKEFLAAAGFDGKKSHHRMEKRLTLFKKIFIPEVGTLGLEEHPSVNEN